MKQLRCSTCGVNVLAHKGFVRFECPNCGEEIIVRCYTCKTLSNTYVCSKCGFEGP